MSKFNSLSLVVTIAGAGILACQPAFSEEQDGWAGEAAFSAGYTTGNTETTDIGLGVDVTRTEGLWSIELVAEGEYGEQDSISYEVDQFTGFDSRTFLGGGLGYHVYDGAKTKWTVRGGPGVKIDEVKREITTDALGAALIIPAETETSLGAVARSAYAYKFNDNVSFSNDTDVLYGETSTQVENSAALTAAISKSISARMSFNVRYDTNPADGFEDTDTALKIALVYGFGQ